MQMRWKANLQNFEYEIKAVAVELSLIEQRSKLIPYQKQVLKECRELLTRAEGAFNLRLPRELMLWQLLHLIRQNLIMVVPFAQLHATWRSLRKRIPKKAEWDGGGRGRTAPI